MSKDDRPGGLSARVSAMPWHAPTYAGIPVYFEQVETQMVEFEADPEAVQALLPEPLKAHPDGRIIAVALKVGNSGAGAFREAGLYVRCSHGEETGVFCSHLYLDNAAAISAGREMLGYPKEHAEITFEEHETVRTCEVRRGGVVIMRISTSHEVPVDEAVLPDMMPVYNLKAIPRADGPGPALLQLLRSNGENFGDSRQYGQDGSLVLASSAKSDLAPLSPRRIHGGYLHFGNFREDYHDIVIDYLKETEDT